MTKLFNCWLVVLMCTGLSFIKLISYHGPLLLYLLEMWDFGYVVVVFWITSASLSQYAKVCRDWTDEDLMDQSG